MVTEQNIQKFSVQCKAIFEQLGRDVIGMREVVEGAVVAMIAGGNVLLEGVPGVGKNPFGAFVGEGVQPSLFENPVHARLNAGRRYGYKHHR